MSRVGGVAPVVELVGGRTSAAVNSRSSPNSSRQDADAAVEAGVEARDAVEVRPVRRTVVRVAADRVAQQQEAADDVVELGHADRDVLGLAVGDPAGPGAGEAVGLGLVEDLPVVEAEPALHGVAELVSHDHGTRKRP